MKGEFDNYFFCFCSAEAKASTMQSKKNLGNQVIRKGWLTIHNISLMRGGSRDFWFILTSESIQWFKDDEVRSKFLFESKKNQRGTIDGEC